MTAIFLVSNSFLIALGPLQLTLIASPIKPIEIFRSKFCHLSGKAEVANLVDMAKKTISRAMLDNFLLVENFFVVNKNIKETDRKDSIANINPPLLLERMTDVTIRIISSKEEALPNLVLLKKNRYTLRKMMLCNAE